MARPSIHLRALGAFAALGLAACEASDNRVDPGDLALRDLLGFEPEVAAAWDADQRASAREVITPALAEAAPGVELALSPDEPLSDGRVVMALVEVDRARFDAGRDALGLVAITRDDAGAIAEIVPFGIGAAAAPVAVEVVLSPDWQHPRAAGLGMRAIEIVGEMATDLGHRAEDGPVVVVPARRLSVAAAYVRDGGEARMLVNPVLIAALEPVAGEAELAAAGAAGAAAAGGDTDSSTSTSTSTRDVGGGLGAAPRADDNRAANPYSFYGSIGECAYAEQLRCEACRPDSTCIPRTVDGDGNVECDAFAADAGRGYLLFCVNMAISIGSVEACVADGAPSCGGDPDAIRSLDDLADNANFVDDTACADAIDDCLAEIFGESEGTYPPPSGQDPTPPRDTSVGCSGDSPNCTFDPSCSATAPSCDNSLSCDSTCANSTDQSGCGGTCESCSSGGGGGGGGGGCSACQGDSDPSTGTGGGCGGGSDGSSGGCDSCSSDSSSGGGCGDSCGSDSGGGGGGCGSDSGGGGGCGSDSGGGGCGGDSGGGGCGGSDSGGGGCGGGDSGGGGGCGGGGGGGSSSCNAARRQTPSSPWTLLVQVLSAFTPVPAAAWVRRRARRRKARAEATEEVQP